MKHSRRALLSGQLLRDALQAPHAPLPDDEEVPAEAFLHGVDRAAPRCSAEVTDEPPPPWLRGKQ